MATYDIGDIVKLQAAFEDDPDSVTFKVIPPNGGVMTTYVYGQDSEVSSPSSNTYVLTLEPDVVGRWQYKVFGEGAYQAAEESSFDVRETNFS